MMTLFQFLLSPLRFGEAAGDEVPPGSGANQAKKIIIRILNRCVIWKFEGFLDSARKLSALFFHPSTRSVPRRCHPSGRKIDTR